MLNETKNEKTINRDFLQAEPAELNESDLLCVSAGLMPAQPRTDCICCKACASNVTTC